MSYAIVLNLTGKTVLVVGAGPVAARKIGGLLGQGAVFRVVAPSIDAEIRELSSSEPAELREKTFDASDLDGVFLVHVATSDSEVNRAVSQAALERGILVCNADEPELGNFQTPSSFSRGDLSVSVTTGGASPTFAAVIRERIESRFGDEFAGWTKLFGRLRSTIQNIKPADARKAYVIRVLDDPKIGAEIHAQNVDAAETAAKQCI